MNNSTKKICTMCCEEAPMKKMKCCVVELCEKCTDFSMAKCFYCGNINDIEKHNENTRKM